MARIEGVDLPRNKRVEVGLTYLYGIGPTRAQAILAQTKVNPDIRVKDLSEADVQAIREFISKNYKVEGDLRREVQMSIKRLIEIGSYRGMRHRRIASRRDSPIFAVTHVLDPSIAERPNQIAGSVARGIVSDDDFEVVDCLAQDAGDRPAQQGCTIMRRNNNADFRHRRFRALLLARQVDLQNCHYLQ